MANGYTGNLMVLIVQNYRPVGSPASYSLHTLALKGIIRFGRYDGLLIPSNYAKCTHYQNT